MREKPIKWLPIDSRLLPFDFTFKTPHSPFIKFLLALEMALAIVSVTGTILLIFLPKSDLLPAIQKSSLCQGKRDCVLGIRIDECCDCPGAYLDEAVEMDPGLVIYEPRKDYRPLRPKTCRKIYCPACSFYDKAYCCSEGTCQGVALPRFVSK